MAKLFAVNLERPRESFANSDDYWSTRKDIFVVSDSLDKAVTAAVGMCNRIGETNDYFTTEIRILAGEDVGEGSILLII